MANEIAESSQNQPPAPQIPTLSEALRSFLQLSGQKFPQWETLADGKLPARATLEIWREFDCHRESETVSHVMQGFVLSCIKRASQRDYVAGLKTRGIAVSAAYRLEAIFQLFNSLPDLDLVRRVSEMNFMAALTVFRALGSEGMANLLADQPVEDLTFDLAQGMTNRELEDWSKKRNAVSDAVNRERQARIDAEARLQIANRMLAEAVDVRSPGIDRPHAAMRDQTVFLASKIGEHAQQVTQIAEKLIDPDWQLQDDAGDRQAVATVMYHSLGGVLAQIAHLQERLQDCFGNHVTAGVQPTLKYPPKMRERLQALCKDALTAAEEDFQAATVQARVKNHLRGRHS